MSEQEKQNINRTETIDYADDRIRIEENDEVGHIDLHEEFRKLCKREHSEIFELEHSKISQENRNLKDKTFELERRLTRMMDLNNRYEDLLMRINLEMNGLRRDNYTLNLKLNELANIHKSQMAYLKIDNDELNLKLKNIHNFYQKILNGFKFVRKKIDIMRRINDIYEHRLKMFDILNTYIY